MRLRGAVAAVESACQTMLADVSGCRLDNAQALPDWAACRDQLLPFFKMPKTTGEPLVLWRLSVPQTAPAFNLPWPQFIEWHGGLRWLWAPASEQVQIRQAASKAGGSASIFIAGSASAAGSIARYSPLEPAIAQIHRRIKAEFDPAGIFNRGRLYPDF